MVRNPVSDTVVNGIQTTAETTVESTRWFIGLTRGGILAAGERVSTPAARSGFSQIASLLMGSTMVGLGVTLFVRANLGVPAFDVMLTALRDQLGLSLGQAGWLFTGAMFLLATMLGQRPRPSALFYTLSNGIAVDTFMRLVREPQVMAVRIGFVALGILIMSAAIALVLHAGFGGGSLELLMKAGEERGLNPFRVRTVLEVLIVGTGFLLGGDFGPATVVFVLTVGPVLRAGRRALSDHRLGRQLRLAVDQRSGTLQSGHSPASSLPSELPDRSRGAADDHGVRRRRKLAAARVGRRDDTHRA